METQTLSSKIPTAQNIVLPKKKKLLANIAELLTHSGISYDCKNLSLMEDISQNLAVSDKKNVFVKVYRRTDGAVEPENTRIARDFGAPTLNLLAATSWCSVWEWAALNPLPLNRLGEALCSMNSFHRATENASLIPEIDYTYALNVVNGRLTHVNHPEKSLIQATVAEAAEQLQSLTAGMPLVFTHGDLQLKNMGIVKRQPVIFDWEICVSAPRELELSKLVENLFTRGVAKNVLPRYYKTPLDAEVLYWATLLRYTQNIAFHWERQEMDTAARQLDALKRFTLLGNP